MAPAKGKSVPTKSSGTSAGQRLKIKVSPVTSKAPKSAKENVPSRVQPTSTPATKATTTSSTQAAKPVNRSPPLQILKTHTPPSRDGDEAELAILRAIVAKQRGSLFYFYIIY